MHYLVFFNLKKKDFELFRVAILYAARHDVRVPSFAVPGSAARRSRVVNASAVAPAMAAAMAACGRVSNHTPKHFQQMECLCDDCYMAQFVATEEELE